MEERVDILLATYNGERYLETQILSILSQLYRNWKLIVHDDGSTDSTIDIIHKYMDMDDRITLVEDGVICHDPARNFLHLLEFSDAQYVMFCDQDDIWFDNKISSMMEEIQYSEEKVPVVVFCQACVWFPAESKSIVGMTMHSYPANLRQFIFSNAGVIGCSSLFNAQAREMLKRWKGECSMHDYILQLICISFGKVIYLDKPLMLYRQHKKSVTPNFSVNRYAAKRILNKKNPVIRREVYNDISHFYNLYVKYLSEENIRIVNLFLSLPYCNKFMKLLYVLINGFMVRGSSFALMLKIMLRKYMI